MSRITNDGTGGFDLSPRRLGVRRDALNHLLGVDNHLLSREIVIPHALIMRACELRGKPHEQWSVWNFLIDFLDCVDGRLKLVAALARGAGRLCVWR